MICPSCHTENRDGAKFCDECGAKLPRAAFEQIEGAEPAQALNIIDDEEPAEETEASPEKTKPFPICTKLTPKTLKRQMAVRMAKTSIPGLLCSSTTR